MTTSSPHRVLQPKAWTKASAAASGIEARGRLIFVGGQIGWNAQGEFESYDLVGQVRQALNNVVDVLMEAGARADHVTSMTWYVLDRRAYSASLKEIRAACRATLGNHRPAMSVVQVAGLIEDAAWVEIQAIAVVPD